MKINFPAVELKTQVVSGVRSVYDRLRSKYVAYTPEEHVRQLFVNYLVVELGYPMGLMGNEVSINQNGIKRRCDTVVFDRYAKPIMIVEYKASSVAITQEVFNQIYRYNLVLKTKYLVVTNGIDVYCCCNDYDNMKCSFLPSIPAYDNL